MESNSGRTVETRDLLPSTGFSACGHRAGSGENRTGPYGCLLDRRGHAVVINGETRYCGIRMPYMSTDPRAWESHPIVLGSNGEGKRYFRSVRVSQLRRSIRPKIREGALAVAERKSNRLLPDIHPVVTLHYGETTGSAAAPGTSWSGSASRTSTTGFSPD